MKEQVQCPVCSSENVGFFLQQDDLPLFCNVTYASQEEALRVERGRMKLGFCRACTHIYNYAFEPHRMRYSEAYENSLHFSPRFRSYARQLAENLTTRYDVKNKTVLEVGCGKGEFLSMLCELGNNRGIGFDMSYPAESTQTLSDRVTIICDDYSERYRHYTADLFCSRHVLEHVADPASFVRLICEASRKTRGAVTYVEVPNALWILQERRIWDVIYEHCSYFTPVSLQRLFEQAGCDVIGLYESFERQYLSIECKPADGSRRSVATSYSCPEDLDVLVEQFASVHREITARWDDMLRNLALAGKCIAVWGSGSKGVMFVNMLGHPRSICYMVDLNPRKQGKYVAGVGLRILAPNELQSCEPHVVIVMNAAYVDEIRAHLRWLGIAPEILVV